ncbi:hypothetical protein GALMADRAFT_214797 [Galerina marginata CBS 339.88]|uniref:VWFA domain-containing protein n=1 Tax=Galerina marginata (strain CBS 339.88) TaxID=685588 RepID=A0A067SQU5_GALM3|nr:hypothetical protein GALMADRAFT_214797 [Galerina marginata CBS 339.88]
MTVITTGHHRSWSSQYAFPVPANGAVCAFKMQPSGGQIVIGSMNEYEIAISNNQLAGLLYDSEAAPDVFVISIGAIPRGQDIEVTIIVSTSRLKVSCRSTSPSNDIGNSICYLSIPRHKSGLANWKGSKTSKYASLVKLDSKARPSRLNSDLILAIRASKLGQPQCVAERCSADRTIAMSMTFVPRFRPDPLPTQEYIFLVDRSSSMNPHDRIGYAKEALTLFLKSLPFEGTFFNVYSYGASYSSLWRSSRQYDASTVKTALNHVSSISADMSPGTEVKIGFENALRSRNPSISTSLFLLTDGMSKFKRLLSN